MIFVVPKLKAQIDTFFIDPVGGNDATGTGTFALP